MNHTMTYRWNSTDSMYHGWTPEAMAIAHAITQAAEQGAPSASPDRIVLDRMITDLRGHDYGYAVTLEFG